MVKLYRVAKPLLICGYHGLTIVKNHGFLVLFFSKTTVNFPKGYVVVCHNSS